MKKGRGIIRFVVLGIILSCCAMQIGGEVYGQDASDCTLSWRSGEPPIARAVCTNERDRGFYRIDFEDKTAAYAPYIPNAGKLRFLLANGDLLFYADDSTLYAVEDTHFRVVWHRPWKDIRLVGADPYDETHVALTTFDGEKRFLHVLHNANGTVTEQLCAEHTAPLLDVVWLSHHLVIVEPSRFQIFARPHASGEPWIKTDDASAPLEKGSYRLDNNGILLYSSHPKSVSYYRFTHHSWTRAAVNATADIRGLGAVSDFAMAVTDDVGTVRIIARFGDFLRNRFEAKYWKLTRDPNAPLVIGDGNLIALDGGSDNRTQIIDTSDVTWRRVALIDYPAAGKLGELFGKTLTTIHPDATDALIFWHVRTGEKLGAISNALLKSQGLGEIAAFQTFRALPRYKRITDTQNRAVIYDDVTKTLSPSFPLSFPSIAPDPQNIALIDRGLFVANDEKNTWTLYRDTTDEQTRISSYALNLKDLSYPSETQTPKEKWYGYCLSDADCFTPAPQNSKQTRHLPSVAPSAHADHSPSALAFLISLLSFIAMFVIRGWRCGFGKRSLLHSATPDDAQNIDTQNADDSLATQNADDSLATQNADDMLDAKNRRVISDRDIRQFLSPKPYSRTGFRIALSIALGLGAAIVIATPYYFDDTLPVYLSWLVVLALPVCALTWVTSSWGYWNRYYLMRYGIIIEGEWRNRAKLNQSIAYVPKAGKTFELSRRQWTRVDYVPLVIFDPARPNFAMQYTGACQHPIAMPTERTDNAPAPSAAYDIKPYARMTALLLLAFAATQTLFQHAYPEPLRARTLNHIATHLPPHQTFTAACLERCHDQLDCIEQCNRRQLIDILNRSGAHIQTDIDTSPAQFLSEHQKAIQRARQVLFDDSPCDKKSQIIRAIPLWNDELNAEFERIYSNLDAFETAHLRPLSCAILRDARLLQSLCDKTTNCAHNNATCPEPPNCPGEINELKSTVCAFQDAIGPHFVNACDTP